MAKEKRTHYERDGRKVRFDYYEKRGNEHDEHVDVIGWGTYGRSSVLAGQASKHFLDSFDTEAEAEAVYGAMGWNNKWTEPSVSLNHLPGEDDFVPGGAYPDDWNDGW